MISASWMWAVDFFAETSFKPACTRTLSTYTVSVTVAVGHLAFIMSQLTFLALPTGVAVTFTIDVIATLIAQHRANTFVTGITTKASITLAMTTDAVSIATAAVRAISHHFAGN